MPINLVDQPQQPERKPISLVEQAPVDSQASLDEAFLATGQETTVPEAKAISTGEARSFVTQLIDQHYFGEEEQKRVDAYRLQGLKDKLSDYWDNPDFFYESQLALGMGEVSAIEARVATNTLLAKRIADEAIAAEDDGWVDAVLDFGGFIARDMTVGVFEKVTSDPKTERLGREVLNAMQTMRPSEFKMWFANDFMARAAEEGIGSQNSWAITRWAEAAFNAGFDISAGTEAALALTLDAPFLAGAAGKLAVAGGRRLLSSGAAHSTTALGRVAAAEGLEAAEEMGSSLIRRTESRGAAAIKETTDMGPTALNPHNNLVTPSESAYSRIRAKTGESVLSRVENIYKSGAAGTIADPEVIRAVARNIGEDIAKTVSYPVLRSFPEDIGLGSYRAVTEIGTKGGSAFKVPASGKIPKGVQALADKLGGEVKVTKLPDGKLEAVVVVKENIASGKLINAIDQAEIYREQIKSTQNVLSRLMGSVFDNPIMGSKSTLAPDEIQSLAEMGESVQAAFKAEEELVGKTFKAVSREDQAFISNKIAYLRDHPEGVLKKDYYTETEFAADYTSMFGKPPSQKTIDAYNAIVDLSDATYVIKSHMIFNKYVSRNYSALELGGVRYPARKLTNLSDLKAGDNIFDGKIGLYRYEDALKDGAEIGDVWKLDRPYDAMGTKVEYVVNPRKVDILDPGDVLGYTSGGPRTNFMARNFVVVDIGGRARAILSAFSTKEAETALEELGNIRQAMKSGQLTDEVVAANSTWAPEITTAADFKKWLDENDIFNFEDTPLARKVRDDIVTDKEAGFGSAGSGASWGDYANMQRSRSDNVLTHFGGNKTAQHDPIQNIADQFASATHQLSFSAYNQVAMTSFVKTVQKEAPQWLPKDVSSSDFRNLFLRTNIEGTSPLARRLKVIQETEMRRMNILADNSINKGLTHLNRTITDFVFDKTGVAMKDYSSSNILLQIGFHSALGMFNLSQAIVQSTHAAAIMAISPKHGMHGASMALHLRGLFHASPEALEEGLRRAAKRYKMSYEDMADMFEYARTSGRNYIEADALELGTGLAHGASSFDGISLNMSARRKAWSATSKAMGKTLKVGAAPYNFGERLSRMTGLWTAALEWKAANPGRKLVGNRSGRMWVARREHNLSMNMTTTSRRLAQDGLLRVPTQWLSHSFNVFESIFLGRGFTAGERARLAAVYMPMFGMTGLGVGHAAESVAEMFGIDPDGEAFTFLKWGFVDGMSDLLMPDNGTGKVGIGLAKRLAPMGAIQETYRKITEGQFLEVGLGPSGEITRGALDLVTNAFANIANGSPMMLTEDLIKILRVPTGIDNVAKANGIFQNGVLRSRTGTSLPFEMTAAEGVAQLLGIGSLKSQEYYDMTSRIFRETKSLQSDRKWLNDQQKLALDHLRSGDPERVERGIGILNELRVWIQFSGHSPQNQRSLRSSLSNLPTDARVDLNNKLMQFDRTYELQRFNAGRN